MPSHAARWAEVALVLARETSVGTAIADYGRRSDARPRLSAGTRSRTTPRLYVVAESDHLSGHELQRLERAGFRIVRVPADVAGQDADHVRQHVVSLLDAAAQAQRPPSATGTAGTPGQSGPLPASQRSSAAPSSPAAAGDAQAAIDAALQAINDPSQPKGLG